MSTHEQNSLLLSLGIRDTLLRVYGLLDPDDRLSFKILCTDLRNWLRDTARVASIRQRHDGPDVAKSPETLRPFRAASTIRLYCFNSHWMLPPPSPGWVAKNFPNATSVELRLDITSGVDLRHSNREKTATFRKWVVRYMEALGLGISRFHGDLSVFCELVQWRPTVAEWEPLRRATVAVAGSCAVPADVHILARDILLQLGENCKVRPRIANTTEAMAELSQYPGRIYFYGQLHELFPRKWPHATSFTCMLYCDLGELATLYTVAPDMAMPFLLKLRLDGAFSECTEEAMLSWIRVLIDVRSRLSTPRFAELVLRSLDLVCSPRFISKQVNIYARLLTDLLSVCADLDPQGVEVYTKKSVMQVCSAGIWESVVLEMQADELRTAIMIMTPGVFRGTIAPARAARPGIMANIVKAQVTMGCSTRGGSGDYVLAVNSLANNVVACLASSQPLARLLHVEPVHRIGTLGSPESEASFKINDACAFLAKDVTQGVRSSDVPTFVYYLASRVLICRDILRDAVPPQSEASFPFQTQSAYPAVVTLRDDPWGVPPKDGIDLVCRRMAMTWFLRVCDIILAAKNHTPDDRGAYGLFNLAETCKEVLKVYIDNAPPALLAAVLG